MESAKHDWKHRAQVTLVEFLNADLDLSFSILDLAGSGYAGPVRHRAAIQNVGRGIEIVRQLEGRVEDLTARERIHTRTNELERNLNTFVGG